MSQKGISYRLNTHITTIAIVIIAIIVYINHHFSDKILVEKIEEGAINQSNLIISKISRITVGAEEIAKNVSFQALYYHRNNDLNSFLKRVNELNKTLENIHVELLDKKLNRFLKFSSDSSVRFMNNFDGEVAEQYLLKLKSAADSSNTGFWTDPFYSKDGKATMLVSYELPIYSPEKKEITGIVSCEVSLSKMRQLLSEINIGKNGYAFIIDKKGNFLTHPKNDWGLYKNFFEKPSLISKENIEEIELKIKNGGRGAFHGTLQYLSNENAWYYYAPFANTNWTVLIVLPEKELYKEIKAGLNLIIFVSGTGIFILFLLNIFIFKRVLDPLVRVTHAIQRFSSIPEKERKSKNEIKMLAESLEDWQAKYGIMIENQTRTASERIKYEKDLSSARDIQLKIIPSGKPDFQEQREIDLYAILKPAEIIGGDLYDYFFIDNDHLLVAIGDVSGKGIPASLFMAITNTLIKANANMLSAKEIISRVNNELCERNSVQSFVTLFLGILDVRTGLLDYCNAAHNYPYILQADGSLHALSESHGLPLGIYMDKIYKSSTVELQFNDTMILFTDGVTNSTDSNKMHYGASKLEMHLQNLTNLTCEEVVCRLMESIILYEGESNQADDITIMALKYLKKTKTQT